MAIRNRRTPEQVIKGLERKLQAVKSKAKNMERAKQTRKSIIIGTTIQGFVDAGDADAKRMMDKVLAGLTRNQDRLVFGLEPLPDSKPASASPPSPAAKPETANPPPNRSLAEAEARLNRALESWKNTEGIDASQVELRRKELVSSIVGFEKLTGICWPGLGKPGQRNAFGLGDRPGELVGAA
jgi:hypothetical protein